MVLLNRDGHQGNVYQRRNLGTWNPQLPAYGRFWMEVPGGERKRKTIPLGRCGAKWIACVRLREYIARVGVNSKPASHENPVPGTTFRQQAERWIESISTRRRRPLKPSTLFGWQHCLDGWILPNLGSQLLSQIGNRALREFGEVLSAAGSHRKPSSTSSP